MSGRSWGLDLSPLRESPDFRKLYIGQFVSSFGSSLSYVVLSWHLYKLTHSTLAVGLLGLVEFVPTFFMAFVGGALADSIDRRKLAIVAEAGLLLVCAMLWVNAVMPVPQIWILFTAAGLYAAMNGLHRPAMEAITPRLVEPDQIPAVSALQSFRGAFGNIVGQSLAGLLVWGFGAAAGYAIDGLTFAVSIGALLLIRRIPPPKGAERASLSTLKEGWKYAASRQELLGTYYVDIVAMFFGIPVALLPAIAEQYGPQALGLFYAMVPLGALLMGLVSGWTKRVDSHGKAITLAACLWGVGIIVFGMANALWAALAGLLVAGAADQVSGVFRGTIWNQTIPDRLRGRLAGIEMISYLTGPYLGNAEAGLVASLWGLRFSVVSGGVMCVVGCAAVAALLPKFWRYSGEAGRKLKDA